MVEETARSGHQTVNQAKLECWYTGTGEEQERKLGISLGSVVGLESYHMTAARGLQNMMVMEHRSSARTTDSRRGTAPGCWCMGEKHNWLGWCCDIV